MRSSTTFLVFFGILAAVVIFSFLSANSTASHPAVRTAQRLMQAIQKNDLAAIKPLVEPRTAKMTNAGNRLVSLRFSEIVSLKGAFSKRPAVLWSYVELTMLKIDEKVPPIIVDGTKLATVPLTNGGKMYLRGEGEDWKVFYIARPEDEKK